MRPSPAKAGLRCPGCAQPMRAMTLERRPHGHGEIDLCDGCHAIWFDSFESVQLMPDATLQLFREVHGAAAPARRAMPTHMPCPRCRASLLDTQDMQRTTRFSYWRCPRSHGRFTPFMHFLREKNFVRPMPAAELERLKAHVRTVRCSGCGAPVELARDMVCRYCRAPIEALDPDAVNATLNELSAAQAQRTRIDVDKLADAILYTGSPGMDPKRATTPFAASGSLLDIVGAGLEYVVATLNAR